MKKILVIEDNPLEIKLYTRYLTKHGYEVFSALNGTLGLEKARRIKPDVILCDKMMPLMDGFEVIKEIRLDPNTSATPFIFCTAVTDKVNMRAGMNLGADDYICKPFNFDDVVNTIEAQIHKSDLREQAYIQRLGFNNVNDPTFSN